MVDLHICLIEPEIPQNTGNIARTCAVTGASHHLVEPMGFAVDSAKLKRAGLDYWDKLGITYHSSLSGFLSETEGEDLFFFSQKGKYCYTEISYPAKVFLVFGKESTGLPDELLNEYRERTLRIPMRSSLRSLNLGNSAAIAVYEVLRQHSFEGLERYGILSN